MSLTLGFDVYGTLIDTHGVVSVLHTLIGDKAHSFSQSWREKQLEYSFRRGLMQQYEDFAVCTSQALDYTCSLYDVDFTIDQKSYLLAGYRSLPTFDDVADGLNDLKANNHRLFAFSNGSASVVDALLVNAGIRDYFVDVISVENIKSFKPNPAVYSHFLHESGAKEGNAWLISSNPFDVIGALCADMQAVWVKRSSNAIFDPWGIEPTLTVENLSNLSEKISH